MSDPMSHQYAILKLGSPHLSDNEAARIVGYADGRPSKRARQLYKAALLVDEMPELAIEALAEIAPLHEKILKLQDRLGQLSMWSEAGSILQTPDEKVCTHGLSEDSCASSDASCDPNDPDTP